MSDFAQTLRVVYLDGRIEDVVIGQRDMAQWEREKFGCATTVAMDRSPVLFVRYLAYAALKRLRRAAPAGEATPTFEVWDVSVDEVVDTGEPVELDPTQPGR